MEYVSSVERYWREQTRLEAESAMLQRLLTRRFGALSVDTQDRLKAASQQQIELWFDRALDALSLSDVFLDGVH